VKFQYLLTDTQNILKNAKGIYQIISEPINDTAQKNDATIEEDYKEIRRSHEVMLKEKIDNLKKQMKREFDIKLPDGTDIKVNGTDELKTHGWIGRIHKYYNDALNKEKNIIGRGAKTKEGNNKADATPLKVQYVKDLDLKYEPFPPSHQASDFPAIYLGCSPADVPPEHVNERCGTTLIRHITEYMKNGKSLTNQSIKNDIFYETPKTPSEVVSEMSESDDILQGYWNENQRQLCEMFRVSPDPENFIGDAIFVKIMLPLDNMCYLQDKETLSVPGRPAVMALIPAPDGTQRRGGDIWDRVRVEEKDDNRRLDKGAMIIRQLEFGKDLQNIPQSWKNSRLIMWKDKNEINATNATNSPIVDNAMFMSSFRRLTELCYERNIWKVPGGGGGNDDDSSTTPTVLSNIVMGITKGPYEDSANGSFMAAPLLHLNLGGVVAGRNHLSRNGDAFGLVMSLQADYYYFTEDAPNTPIYYSPAIRLMIGPKKQVPGKMSSYNLLELDMFCDLKYIQKYKTGIHDLANHVPI